MRARALRVFVFLVMACDALAVPRAKLCRQACQNAVERCVGASRTRRRCRAQVQRRCRKIGLAACATTTTATTSTSSTVSEQTPSTVSTTTTSATTSTTHPFAALLGTWDFTADCSRCQRSFRVSDATYDDAGHPVLRGEWLSGYGGPVTLGSPVDLLGVGGYAYAALHPPFIYPPWCELFLFDISPTGAAAGIYTHGDAACQNRGAVSAATGQRR